MKKWGVVILNLGLAIFDIGVGGYILQDGHVPYIWGFVPVHLALAGMWWWLGRSKEIDMNQGYAQGGNYYGYPGLMSTPYPVIAPAPWTGKVEPRTEPITGWRGYQIDPNATLSGVRAAWSGKKFEAECTEGREDELAHRQQVQSMLRDDEVYQLWLKKNMKSTPAAQCVAHLESATCTCGVWGKALLETVEGAWPVFAHCQAYGVVASDVEGNFRASEVQIDRLWVVRNSMPRAVVPTGPSPWGVNVLANATGNAYLAQQQSYALMVMGQQSQAAIPWYAEYIDWQRVADLLRDKYAVPVTLVDSKEEISL